MERILGPREAGQALGVTVGRVWQLVWSGRITPDYVSGGRYIFFKPETVEQARKERARGRVSTWASRLAA